MTENGFEISEDGIITEYTGTKTDVVILQEICGIAVRAIDKGAFYEKKLIRVIFPESITEIGEWAFCNNQLVQVVIPEGVKKISDFAFMDNQLVAISIPDSVTQIGNFAFNINQLTAIIIPESVTKIDREAFMNNQLNSITIYGKISLPRKSKWVGPAFDNGFDDFYKNNEKKSGTYLFNGTNWGYKR